MTEPFLRVFCVIDSFIAKVVNSLFELLNTVIDYRFFGTDKIIGSVIEKVYVLFAIFLLFKTSVEIINFIISPDKLSSKDQGAASFVKRIIITLALMVSFPFIFDKAQELQKEVINSGLLEKVVFGTSGMTNNGTGALDNASYNFEKNLYGGFIGYSYGENSKAEVGPGCKAVAIDDTACGNMLDRHNFAAGYAVSLCYDRDEIGFKVVGQENIGTDENGKPIYQDITEPVYDQVCSVDLELSCRQEIMGWYKKKNYDRDNEGNIIKTNGDNNEEISVALEEAINSCNSYNKSLASKHPGIIGFKFTNSEPEDFYPSNVKKSDKYEYYVDSQIEDADYYLRKLDIAISDRMSISELFKISILAEGRNGQQAFKYRVGLPTILGIFVIIFLAFFCIDCIYRSLRLMFFEMVAPLAIATYVDHRSATSGIFNKWVRQTVMAYIELFIKFISLYFIIFMVVNINEIKLIGSTKPLSLNENPLLVIIIMAAIVYFAWYLPKFLKQSLGINVESNGSYSLFKQAKEKLMKFYKTTLKVLAAVGISVATGGAAAAAAGGGAAGGAAAGATTATAATTTATGTGAAATATGTGAAATATGTGAAATATTAGANAAGASAASMAGANAVANTAAQGVNQGAQIAKQMARSGIRAGIDAIRNPDKSLFNIVSDATEWSSKLRNLDAHGIGFKERALNQLNKTFQLDSGSMGAYDGLVNSLKEAEMKIKDITDNFEILDNMINSTIANNSIPSNEFNEAFAGEHIIGDDGRYYIDMKYEDYDAFIAANPDSVITQEIYDQFRELIERKQELKNEEFMAEAEKEEWEELLEDLNDV